MSNEYAPDSRQSVDLKWKLRKALEKNVAPRDDGKGLDFGQDVGVDGKLHLNELSDIVGPSGNPLFTDETQMNLAQTLNAVVKHFYDGRYTGIVMGYQFLEQESKLFNVELLADGATSFVSTFNGAIFIEELVSGNGMILADFGTGCDFDSMFAHSKGALRLKLGNGAGSCRSMFNEAEIQSVTVRDGKSFEEVGDGANMFRGCHNLVSVSKIDFSSAQNLDLAFYDCPALASIDCTGFRISFDVSDTALGHDALVVLINSLETVTTVQTLTIGDEKLALLSDEEKLGATNKGWTLA